MKITTKLKKIFTPKVIAILLLIVTIIVAAAALWGQQLVELFSDQERMKALINSAGPWAPLVFVLLQTAQVVLAPIPGNVTGIVGGIAFDWWGLPLTMIGTVIGIAIVTAISRRFGRPLIERLFGKEDIKKFDFLIGNKAEIALFLIFLLPFFPDDLIGYLAGLTNIRFRNVLIIAMAGRFPMQVVYNFFGGRIFEGDVLILVIILAVMGLLAVLLYIHRRWMYDLVKADSQIEFIKTSYENRKKQAKTKRKNKKTKGDKKH